MTKTIMTTGCLLAVMVLYASACSPVALIGPNASPVPLSSISALIAKLSSPDPHIRTYAAEYAGFYGDDPDKARLVDPLVAALTDPDSGVRAFAAQSLGQLDIYDPRTIKILTSWLTEAGHSDDELSNGIRTLGVFPRYTSGATPGLIRIMMVRKPGYPSPTYHLIRQSAIETLSAIGDPVAIPYLLSVFISPGELPWLRKSAAIGLAKYRQAANCSVPYVIPILNSSEPEIRINSAIIINSATGNNFPDGNRDTWDSGNLDNYFSKGGNSEFLIVSASEKWWQAKGQFGQWPPCQNGLDGKPVIP